MGFTSSLMAIASSLVRWREDERGTAIVEYLLLVVLIAIVAMVAITAFGEANHDKFVNMANSIS